MKAPIDDQVKITYVKPVAKWIRAYLDGQLVVDTRKAILVGREGRPPVYFIPKQDVVMEYLSHANMSSVSNAGYASTRWDIRVGECYMENAAMEYNTSLMSVPLASYLTFDWSSMDAWYEEQEQVFVHPRDPYVRVDTLHSSRHIKVIVHGETVAESQHPVLLFETGLPVRYYIPRLDVRLDLLFDSDLVTYCPYKGEARYYSLRISDQIEENIAWYYQYPVMESAKIASYIAFYEERVGTIEVDGEPLSQFSGP